MKKMVALLMTLLMLLSAVAVVPAMAEEKTGPDFPPMPTYLKINADVVAVFAGAKVQPVPELPEGNPPADAAPEKLDAIWIYYSDGTFDEYAEMGAVYELFSDGTYTLGEDTDFIVKDTGNNGTIIINRTHKYSPAERRVAEYASTNVYQLGTLGYTQLFSPADEGKKITAIYGDTCFETYEDEKGVTRYLDTIWFFFGDNSFRQYAFLNDEVVLYSSGTYAFDENSDFSRPIHEEDHGTITLIWDYSMDKDAHLTRTCDLNSLGLRCLYEYVPENFAELDDMPDPQP